MSDNGSAQNNTGADDGKQQDQNGSAGQGQADQNNQGGTQQTQGTGDQQQGQQTQGAGDQKGAKAADGAPESYADFTMPEGTEVSKESLGQFTTLAKDMNLSQDNAQKLVDLAATHTQRVLEQQQAQWTDIRKGWVDGLKADKEFGGDKFNETVERAKRTLSKYGSEGLTDFLEKTGYGDNPDVIKMLAKIDRAMSEDRAADGTATSNEKSAADVLYPQQNK